MAANRVRRALLPAAIVVAGMGGSAFAEPLSLNYESLSSMEEPLAVEVADVTFILTGLVDAQWSIDTEGSNDTDTAPVGANYLI